MSGRESGRDVDALEVVPGAQRDNLQGWIAELANEDELRQALEQAFSYRGDVRITRKDGSQLEGYVFDRRSGRTLADSAVRILPKDGTGRVSIFYADIAGIAFTGRDTAAGNSWENWVKQYWERKAAGEKNISLAPEKLAD